MYYCLLTTNQSVNLSNSTQFNVFINNNYKIYKPHKQFKCYVVTALD